MSPAPDDGFEPAYYPLLLQLGLTYRCNLACPHCYALYHRTRDELDTQEVRALIDDAAALGAAKVVYSHGENLIRSDFHELAAYLAAQGFFQTLMSNGYFLQRDDQAVRLCEAGVNKVMISLDSDVDVEHNANRGRDNAYSMALGALRTLRRRPGLKLGISMAIAPRNYARIEAVAALAFDLGLDFLSVMQVRPNLPGTFARFDWTGYDTLCRNLYELILAYRGRLDIYTHDPFMNTLRDARLGNELAHEDFIAHNQCNVGKYMLSICPNGDVTGCNFIERVVGNVRQEPLAAIWARLVHEYADVAAGDDSACGSCAQLSTCGRGCKAFHMPYTTRSDKRCEAQPFVEWPRAGTRQARRVLL